MEREDGIDSQQDSQQISGQIFARSTREDCFPVLVRYVFLGVRYGDVVSSYFFNTAAVSAPRRRFTLPSSQCESQQTRAETTAACQHCQRPRHLAKYTCSDSCKEQAPRKERATPDPHRKKWTWKVQPHMSC